MLQAPNNDKNLDKRLKGFVEGIKAAMGIITVTEEEVCGYIKGLEGQSEQLVILRNNRIEEAALVVEAKEAGVTVGELKAAKAASAEATAAETTEAV